MADTQTRLQTLLDKMAKLEAEKTELLAQAEAEKAIGTIGADLAEYIQKQAVKVKVDVKVLHGKFFALTVGEDGELTVSLTTKAKSNGNGKASQRKANGNGNGGEYEYYLANGEGPFPDIQSAMDKMAIPKANRPAHNRYDRLSKTWQDKIDRRPKATEPAAEPATKPATEPAES